jgi:hypothetical protein
MKRRMQLSGNLARCLESEIDGCNQVTYKVRMHTNTQCINEYIQHSVHLGAPFLKYNIASLKTTDVEISHLKEL